MLENFLKAGGESREKAGLRIKDQGGKQREMQERRQVKTLIPCTLNPDSTGTSCTTLLCAIVRKLFLHDFKSGENRTICTTFLLLGKIRGVENTGLRGCRDGTFCTSLLLVNNGTKPLDL